MICTTPSEPVSAAAMSGVRPFLSLTHASTPPNEKSSRTTASWPYEQAIDSVVSPRSFRMFTSALCDSSRCTTSTWPDVAAAASGDVPLSSH
eukprot:5177533-Prymnesium_polylepis.1